MKSSRILVNDILVEPSSLRVKVSKQWQEIEPKQLALLLLLIKHQGQCVTRDTIIEKLWPNTLVCDNSVSQLIAQLRKTLQESKSAPKYIKTIPRKGYQLIALVSEPPNITETLLAPRMNRPIYWLLFGVLLGVFLILFSFYVNKPKPQTSPFEFDSRLTSAPGLEVYLRYSPDGRFLAFSHLGENQSQFDLSVYDSKSKIIHSLKNSSYSEEAPVWSPDGKWLAYYRFDPFKCEVRVIRVDQTIEMWRLAREKKLFDCELGYGPRKLFWLPDNKIAFNTQKINKQIVEAYELDSQLNIVKKKVFEDIQGEILDIDPLSSHLLMQSNLNGNNYYTRQCLVEALESKIILSDSDASLAIWYQEESKIITADQKLMLNDVENHSKYELTVNPRLIGDLDYSKKSGTLAHAEGFAKVSIYKLKTTQPKQKLIPISSATQIDIAPSVSDDGDYFAFVSQQSLKSLGSEVWIRNKRKANAEQVYTIDGGKSATLLLFSPDNQYLALMTDSDELLVINLFTKSAVNIANEFNNLRNVFWAEDSQTLNFTSTDSEGQALNWRYTLLKSGNELVKKSINWPKLYARNISFSNYSHDLKSYLLPKISAYFDETQLTASFSLYLPTLYKSGAFFILREGHRLSLYQYNNVSAQLIFLQDIGTHLYDINAKLSMSTDQKGQQVLINRIDAIEMDIVLHREVKDSL